MPADWTSLPVHAGLKSPSSCGSIAVYTKNSSNQNLVYEGYICPAAPEKVPLSALQPPPMPPREESFGQKYARLREKIIAEEARAEALAEIISENKRNRAAVSAASSKPGQSVVRVVPSTMTGREDAAVEPKQQIKAEAEATSESKNKPEYLRLFLQRTESNTDYPLPLEILDRRERLLPVPPEGGTEEFIPCFEPWESTVDLHCLYVDSGL